MNKESLIKARDLIIEALEKSEITQRDKVELMLNLMILLDEENYEEDIQTLQLTDRRRKR